MYAPRKAPISFYVSGIFSDTAGMQFKALEFLHLVPLSPCETPFDFKGAYFLE